MVLPKMTPEQMAEMQKKAKASREAQAKAIEGVKNGSYKQFEKLIDTDQKTLKKIKAKRLMTSLPGIGAKGYENFCNEHGIDTDKRIGGLGSKQKEVFKAWAKEAYAK